MSCLSHGICLEDGSLEDSLEFKEGRRTECGRARSDESNVRDGRRDGRGEEDLVDCRYGLSSSSPSV